MEEILLQMAAITAATLRVATPLIFCALAGLCSERAGVIDIGLEGKMLAAAFAAACLAAAGFGLPLALLGAVLTSLGLSLVHGFAAITHRGDQVVSGVALNLIAAGLSAVLGIHWYGRGGQTPDIGLEGRFLPLFSDLAERAAGSPLAMAALEALRHNLLVYLALLLPFLFWWILYRSRFGLRLRAVGENPQLVDMAGISVAGLRYRAVCLGGVLCGLAGAYLVLAQNASFTPNMTAGRGFMALAALIFGKWRPLPSLFACLLFGFLDAVSIPLQGVSLPGLGAVPVQLIQALPYLLTVILLAGFIGRAVAPKAIGLPYIKER